MATIKNEMLCNNEYLGKTGNTPLYLSSFLKINEMLYNQRVGAELNFLLNFFLPIEHRVDVAVVQQMGLDGAKWITLLWVIGQKCQVILDQTQDRHATLQQNE